MARAILRFGGRGQVEEFQGNNGHRDRTVARPDVKHALFECESFRVVSLSVLLMFHKPYGVLSQFTPDGSPNRPLSGFGFPGEVYPIGRLDADSEGLLLLTDERELNARLLHPSRKHWRTYWAQVERVPCEQAMKQLEGGVGIQGYRTLPCQAALLESEPQLPPRNPPIRYRKTVPTAWLELRLVEGKNRQVRRMTAAIGHPTLRLVRVAIGGLKLGSLEPGEWKEATPAERALIFR